MNKQTLVDDLCKRQIELGEIDKETIHSLSSDEIIDAYITCSHCKEKSYKGNIDDLINASNSTENFLQIVAHNHKDIIIQESIIDKSGNKIPIGQPMKRHLK